MLYLKRKIDQLLKEWKQDEERKPLIIKGPRQIGKTESVLRFAKEHYENIVYIDFVREPKYRMIIGNSYTVNDIIKNISLIDPAKKFIASKTLIVFDEIQALPDIAKSFN